MDMENEEKLLEIARLLPDQPMDDKAIQQAVAQILVAVGENPERHGLKDTPQRVARMYTELLAGYRDDQRCHF